MKKKIICLLLFCAVSMVFNLSAQNKQEDFRQTWMTAERKYSVEYLRKLEAENRREFVKLFFDLGKEYFENEDYPAALVSFKRVIQLESEEREKEFTLLSGQYLEAIDNRIMGQIEARCSKTCDKDLKRLKKGIDEILAQKPVIVYEPEPEPVSEQAEQGKGKEVKKERVKESVKAETEDPKLKEIEKMKDEVLAQKRELEKDKALMRLRLKKEILSAKTEIEKLLFDKKTREIADKRKAEERFISLRQMYKEKKYQEALKEAEEILVLDPEHRETKKIKAYIKDILARQKAKEERAQARSERKRLKKEAILKKKVGVLLKDAEKDILKQRFVRAGRTLQKIMDLDPGNQDAQRFLEYIELKVKGFSQE